VIAQEGAKRIDKDTLVVVDPTDIRKLYVRNELNLKRAVEHADSEQSPVNIGFR